MVSSPTGSPKTLVFWRQISSPNSKGFPPNGASNKGRSEKCNDFYPRDAMLARVIEIATCPSVCLSVCLSITRRYCVKTKKASGVISSPSGSPKTLVFWRQISSPNNKGFPPNGASNMGRSKKFSDFLALSVYISKTVADTAKVTISHY